MFYIDSADPKEIAWAFGLGIVSGVTTNPILLSKVDGPTSTSGFKEKIEAVCAAAAVPWRTPTGIAFPQFPISVQLKSGTFESMLEEAAIFRGWDSRIVVKIPFSEVGLRVATRLSLNAIPVNVTAVMSFTQAYAAVLTGARYVSVICGRIQDSSGSSSELLKQLLFRLRQEQRSTKVIAASLRQPGDVSRALTAGAHIATVTPEVLRKSLQHPATDQMVAEFAAAGRTG